MRNQVSRNQTEDDMMAIEYVSKPSEKAREFLAKGFEDYSKAVVNDNRESFCFIDKDGSDERFRCVAVGYTCLSGLYLKQLLVDPSCRKQGVGKAMMESIEELAQQRGCHKIWVDTMSYQAPDFYEKAGFTEYSRVVGFQGDFDRVFFCKEF